MPNSQFTPVTRGMLQLGKPLTRAVYTSNGDLLLSQGYVIETQEQIDSLFENGYFKADALNPGKIIAANGDTGKRTVLATQATPSVEPAERNEEYVALDDVRWQVGETFFLHQQGSAIRYTARFIGYIKGKTVLVTMPVVDDKYVLIREGQQFIVRAFSGKKAYAFSALVMKSVHTPHPYLHLSYPRQLSCATIRHRTRIPVNVIASVSIGEQDDAAAAVITDMSLGGASAVIKHPHGQLGERSRIRFKINAVGETVLMDLVAVLRSISPLDNGNGCRHGYEFIDLSTQDRLVLSAFFHQAEVER
jgi:c-di-GMP-binding flagellar brake protein YcgR